MSLTTRSQNGGAISNPTRAPTTFKLSGAFAKMKKQMQLMGLKGVWMNATDGEGRTTQTFGVAHGDTIQTQFSTTDSTVTLFARASKFVEIKTALQAA